MQRYKRADLFSRTLHRLVIHRMVKDDSSTCAGVFPARSMTALTAGSSNISFALD